MASTNCWTGSSAGCSKVGAQRAGFSSKLGRLLADRMPPRAAPLRLT